MTEAYWTTPLAVIGTGIGAWLLFYLVQRLLFLRRLPPGPWGLPFIGSLIHLNRKDAVAEICKYANQYGPIYSLGVGNFNVIVITGYKLIQEASKVDSLLGRPKFEFMQLSNDRFQHRGILYCEPNSTWNEQRKFALKSLKGFGFGKQSMDQLLQSELDALIRHFKTCVGTPIAPRNSWSVSIINSLWIILTGWRFEIDDPMLARIIESLALTVKYGRITGPGVFFPAVVKLLKRSIWSMSQKMRVDTLSFIRSQVEEHEKTYQEDSTRDFIDAYLHERKKGGGAQPSFQGEEGLMNLVIVLKDLFTAGIETTSSTLLWTILYAVQYPEIQAKVQAELDAVVGRDRVPNREDKPQLCYLEAFLNEVHRKCSLVPMSVYRGVVEDTEFEGHFFPKDTVVFVNLHEAMNNKAYWGDPRNFRPERFLDETGTKLIKHEPFVPFGIGKRQCLGEPMARDTLFLFVSGLLQQFSFELAPESRDKDLREADYPTFVMQPKDFKVILKQRY